MFGTLAHFYMVNIYYHSVFIFTNLCVLEKKHMQKISVLVDAIFLKVIDETNKICLLFQ